MVSTVAACLVVKKDIPIVEYALNVQSCKQADVVEKSTLPKIDQ